MNNIFLYSPKELATDAFLAWCIQEYDGNTAGQKLAGPFFHSLGLCNSQNDLISDIRVSRQEKHTDLIIRYFVNGSATQALFENKIYTTVHSEQLEQYSKDFPDFQFYKYLKLGYINYEERKQVKNSGYTVIDAYKLRSALAHTPSNILVDQYKEFLDTQFIRVQDEIKNELIINNKHQLFERSEAQQYILSSLHEKIDRRIPYLEFKYAANSGGTPWTQLFIAKRDNAYGDEAEYLAWRIDKRGQGYYLRLNQYSYIDDQDWSRKEKNLQILRDFVTHLLERHELVLGPHSNRGRNESEIAIMFFIDNHLSRITHLLPSLSEEISNFYSSYSNWV